MGLSDKNLEKTLYCSFCGRSHREVERMVAGPATFICGECVRLCANVIAEAAPPEAGGPTEIAWPKDVGEEQLLAMLKNQDTTLERVRERLQATIDILRRREVSWEKIGRALGCSRQAAWERFG